MCVHVIVSMYRVLRVSCCCCCFSVPLHLLIYCVFILNTQLYGWSYQLTNFKLAEVTNFMHDFRICHTVLCYHCTLVLTLIFYIFAELIIPPHFIVSPAGSFPSYFLPSACSSLHLQEKKRLFQVFHRKGMIKPLNSVGHPGWVVSLLPLYH